jgi:copper resistance protein B
VKPRSLLLFLSLAQGVLAQAALAQDHAEHAAAAAAEDHSMHVMPAATAPVTGRDESQVMQEARHMSSMMHGETLNWLLLGERFEQREDDGDTAYLWELQGWVGRDLDKLWFKTEGHYDARRDTTERTEVQLLYSRAIAPFWDLQAGLRVDGGAGPSRTHAVLGVMGLAPYWFEVDAAVFLGERGDPGARLEAEYELRFTQKLLLQPRLELNYSADDDPAVGVGQGLNEASFGLRLRYEFRREIAPYLGVEWSRAYGATANLLRTAGKDREELSVVAGLRFWY